MCSEPLQVLFHTLSPCALSSCKPLVEPLQSGVTHAVPPPPPPPNRVKNIPEANVEYAMVASPGAESIKRTHTHQRSCSIRYRMLLVSLEAAIPMTTFNPKLQSQRK